MRPRSAAEIFRHGPLSKAACAARTALSTSAESASATWAITSPVAGLMVGNVLPDSLLTHRLLINSLVALTATGVSTLANADAMVMSPLEFRPNRLDLSS